MDSTVEPSRLSVFHCPKTGLGLSGAFWYICRPAPHEGVVIPGWTWVNDRTAPGHNTPFVRFERTQFIHATAHGSRNRISLTGQQAHTGRQRRADGAASAPFRATVNRMARLPSFSFRRIREPDGFLRGMPLVLASRDCPGCGKESRIHLNRRSAVDFGGRLSLDLSPRNILQASIPGQHGLVDLAGWDGSPTELHLCRTTSRNWRDCRRAPRSAALVVG